MSVGLATSQLFKPLELERKYVLSERAAEDFLAELAPRLTLRTYDPERPISFSRTTYLDTDDLRYLEASRRDGAFHLRVREYASAPHATGAPLFQGLAYLEVKQRTGARRRKLRLEAPTPVIERLLAEQGRIDELTRRRLGTAIVDEIVPLLEEGMAPRVVAWYRRATFLADGGQVRITVDQDIEYREPQGAYLAPGPAVVLEVKHVSRAPAWLTAALAALPEATSFSKFRDAMARSVRCAA